MRVNVMASMAAAFVGLSMVAVASGPAFAASGREPSNKELLELIHQLQQELAAEKEARLRDQQRQREENQRTKEAAAQQAQQAAQAAQQANQAAQAAQAKAEQAAQTTASAGAGEGWWNNTKISGRMYYNISNINNKRDGVKQKDSGTGFDVKRFYVSIDHKFSDIFSADVTTDFTYDSGAGATQVYIKKAYVEANLDPALDIRFGSTDLPWIPFVEGIYGYRYVENTLIDRTKFGTSADWGIHLKGKLADGMLEYAFSVIDGAGYKHPFRSKSVDFEGRVNVNFDNFVVAVGGYTGKLGNDVQGMTTYHTASRLDALIAYKTKQIRVGVEGFLAKNWSNVATTYSDKSEGIGAFASYQFDPQWGIFGRFDYVRPNKRTNPDLNDTYFNVGIAYSPTKIVDFALVYKRDKADNGLISTSNGKIGGMYSGTYDEIGIWGRARW